MGRHTKLTPQLQETVLQLIRAGNYQCTACQAVGIGTSTLDRWMKDERPLYRAFREACEKATAEAEARNLLTIQEEARGTWQAAAWYLERKFAERWGRKDTTKHEGGDPDRPMRIIIEEYTEEAAEPAPEE